MNKKENEDKVFGQDLSQKEMEQVSGGKMVDRDFNGECVSSHERWIQRGGFPNCAATVEDGSWCDTNDACYSSAIAYFDMRSCKKAWE